MAATFHLQSPPVGSQAETTAGGANYSEGGVPPRWRLDFQFKYIQLNGKKSREPICCSL